MMNFLVLLGRCPQRRFLFLAFIWLLPVLLPSPLLAQEICDNGIDDDGDGLIDLNDSLDCVCTEPNGTFSILPNASFENFNPDNEGCFTAEPDGRPDNLEQLDCLDSWQQSSQATTDVWNANTFTVVPGVPCGGAPLPFPSGESAVGFVSAASTSIAIPGYQEYLSACFIDGYAMSTDSAYRFSFQLGFKDACVIFPEGGEPYYTYSPSTAQVALYGIRACSDIGFQATSCPQLSNSADGWELIEEFTVSGVENGWSSAEVVFTPAFPYQAIGFGPACNQVSFNEPYEEWSHYYWLDDLRLNTIQAFEDIPFGPITVVGTECDEDLQLIGQSVPGATYQWYQDGVALLGQDAELFLPFASDRGAGAFQLRTTLGESCALSDAVYIAPPSDTILLPADSFAICPQTPAEGVEVGFPEANGEVFFWSDGSTGAVRRFSTPGDYSVTITSSCTERVKDFHVTDQLESSFRVDIDAESGCPAPLSIPFSVVTNWNFSNFEVTNDQGELLFEFTNAEVEYEVQPPYPDFIEVTGRTEFCDPYVVRVDLDVNDPIPVTVVTDAITCTEGNISLTVPDGLAPTYRWEGPTGASLGSQSSISATVPGIYSVTITDGQRCDFIGEYELFADTLTLAYTKGTDNCSGVALEISVEGGTPPYQINWLSSEGASIAENINRLVVDEAGDYFVLVTDSAECASSVTITVEAEELVFVPDLGGTVFLDIGESTELGLEELPASDTQYEWSPINSLSCSDCSVPTASPLESTVYELLLRSGDGCLQSASVTVIVDDSWSNYLPTAFSPNGDGVNDVFRTFPGRSVVDIESFEIYGRWGQLIWAASMETEAWDGRMNGRSADVGVYAYRISLELVGGRTVQLEGMVTLVR